MVLQQAHTKNSNLIWITQTRRSEESDADTNGLLESGEEGDGRDIAQNKRESNGFEELKKFPISEAPVRVGVCSGNKRGRGAGKKSEN